MKERPIIFTGPSLPAIMVGRKTQTRRPINVPRMRIEFRGGGGKDGADWNDPSCWGFEYDGEEWALAAGAGVQRVIGCPYGAPGDRLWVRETWGYAPSRYCYCPQTSEPSPCDSWAMGEGCDSKADVVYRASTPDGAHRWRSPRFMPRWASRLLLEVTEVRVQRLHEISEDDARAEGVELHPEPSATTPYRSAFIRGWEGINGKRAPWASNPWVHAVSFKVIP